MRRWPLLFCTALAACAAPGGAWPSLAKRPIETATAPTATALAAPNAGSPAAVDAATRLVIIDRDLKNLEDRAQIQRKLTDHAATAAAHGDAAAQATWQLESGRLEKLGGQLAVLRERLDGIAGELAVAATSGADVGATLRDTGALIVRSDTLAVLCRGGTH